MAIHPRRAEYVFNVSVNALLHVARVAAMAAHSMAFALPQHDDGY